MLDNPLVQRLILLGDVVGDPGLQVLQLQLPGLIQELHPDIVVVNGENAAGGFGLTAATLEIILQAGADVVTSGNHVWEKREFLPVLSEHPRVLRPANYPEGVPGHGYTVLEKDGVSWCVINLQGREEMTPIDCPFKVLDQILLELQNLPVYPLVAVDFHAESNQEKEALALYADGRVTIIVGTHTHVQTTDERILPGGMAYCTDIGMTGVVDSSIGMDTIVCLERNKTQVPYRMQLAEGHAMIQGAMVDIDRTTGRALLIQRLQS